MRLASPALLTLAVLGTTACDEPSAIVADAGSDAFVPQPDAGEPLDDAGPPPSDSGPDAATVLDAGDPPSEEFVALYETVIVRHCAGEYCHLSGTTAPGDGLTDYMPTLQMPDAATARAVLVDRRLECMFAGDDRTRVVPFDPTASAIMTVAGDGLCGLRHNNAVPDLTTDDLAMIESWIAGGAL